MNHHRLVLCARRELPVLDYDPPSQEIGASGAPLARRYSLSGTACVLDHDGRAAPPRSSCCVVRYDHNRAANRHSLRPHTTGRSVIGHESRLRSRRPPGEPVCNAGVGHEHSGAAIPQLRTQEPAALEDPSRHGQAASAMMLFRQPASTSVVRRWQWPHRRRAPLLKFAVSPPGLRMRRYTPRNGLRAAGSARRIDVPIALSRPRCQFPAPLMNPPPALGVIRVHSILLED
jgi:hypothetical protein